MRREHSSKLEVGPGRAGKKPTAVSVRIQEHGGQQKMASGKLRSELATRRSRGKLHHGIIRRAIMLNFVPVKNTSPRTRTVSPFASA